MCLCTKADNKDFFEWSVSNGMLMPDPGLLFLPPRPRTLDKLSGDGRSRARPVLPWPRRLSFRC